MSGGNVGFEEPSVNMHLSIVWTIVFKLHSSFRISLNRLEVSNQYRMDNIDKNGGNICFSETLI